LNDDGRMGDTDLFCMRKDEMEVDALEVKSRNEEANERNRRVMKAGI